MRSEDERNELTWWLSHLSLCSHRIKSTRGRRGWWWHLEPHHLQMKQLLFLGLPRPDTSICIKLLTHVHMVRWLQQRYKTQGSACPNFFFLMAWSDMVCLMAIGLFSSITAYFWGWFGSWKSSRTMSMNTKRTRYSKDFVTHITYILVWSLHMKV